MDHSPLAARNLLSLALILDPGIVDSSIDVTVIRSMVRRMQCASGHTGLKIVDVDQPEDRRRNRDIYRGQTCL